MDQWGPRRATSLKEARARTALVHILRLLFTIGAVLSAGVLIGFIVKDVLAHKDGAPPPPTGITVLGPQFQGRDSHGKPYKLTADTARRRRENANLVDLTNPHLEDSTSTTVQARDGVYDEKSRILDLVGDVVMQDAGGYTFTTERARMYVEEGRVEGKTPLHGVGAMGEVTADSYEVLDDGNRIVLKGNVSTIFTSKRKRSGGAGNR
ncbi:MAG TPA: LPS export ABC transporter periplasmic protein LptC [Hyphomonadaceae bacterium]|nr:LPS export ABC transporter periplasmic protein LptC [Hyphomonadaceae bacterium]